MNDKTTILFLCTGNSCRSQMAEGWAKTLKPDELEVYSAGIETHGLNLNAVRVMAEAGVDIANNASKIVDDLPIHRFDFVITLCGHANETCPVFPGDTTILHVGFDDPPALAKDAETEEAALVHYRRVRDEIRQFVAGLPQSLPQRPPRMTAVNDSKEPVLIVGEYHSARSLMAKAFLKVMAGHRWDVESAGIKQSTVDPLAVEVMREVGLDIVGETFQSVFDLAGRHTHYKYVITVCDQAAAQCPNFPRPTRKLAWSFDDPASFEGSREELLSRTRRVRDDIKNKIKQWLNEMKEDA